MSDQTLFGKGLEDLRKKDKPDLEKRIEHKLPLDVHPRILEGLDEVEVSFMCTIANSTAKFSGKIISHTVSTTEHGINNGNYKWYVDVLNTTEEGRRRVKEAVAAKFNQTRNILNGPNDLKIQLGFAGELVPTEEYKKSGAWTLDREIQESAQAENLTWERLIEARDLGSNVAHWLTCDKPYFDPGNVSAIIPYLKGRIQLSDGMIAGLNNHQSYDYWKIPDVHIGGIPHDKGADSITKLVRKEIGHCFNKDTLEKIPDVYAMIEFLQAQGYRESAKKLKKRLQEGFIARLKQINDPNTFITKPYLVARDFQNFLRLTREYDSEAYEPLREEVVSHTGKIKEILTNAQNSREYVGNDFDELLEVLEK